MRNITINPTKLPLDMSISIIVLGREIQPVVIKKRCITTVKECVKMEDKMRQINREKKHISQGSVKNNFVT